MKNGRVLIARKTVNTTKVANGRGRRSLATTGSQSVLAVAVAPSAGRLWDSLPTVKGEIYRLLKFAYRQSGDIRAGSVIDAFTGYAELKPIDEDVPGVFEYVIKLNDHSEITFHHLSAVGWMGEHGVEFKLQDFESVMYHHDVPDVNRPWALELSPPCKVIHANEDHLEMFYKEVRRGRVQLAH